MIVRSSDLKIFDGLMVPIGMTSKMFENWVPEQ